MHLVVAVVVSMCLLLVVGSSRGDVIGLHILLRCGLGRCGEGEKDENGGGGELDHDDFFYAISICCFYAR